MAECVRSMCVCVSVFLCVRSGPVNQSSLKWELNANSSKTDFKFDTRVPRDSPDMTPKFFPKGRGQCHVTPKFWALNANSSKMVTATDFRFDKHVSSDSPDMKHVSSDSPDMKP